MHTSANIRAKSQVPAQTLSKGTQELQLKIRFCRATTKNFKFYEWSV